VARGAKKLIKTKHLDIYVLDYYRTAFYAQLKRSAKEQSISNRDRAKAVHEILILGTMQLFFTISIIIYTNATPKLDRFVSLDILMICTALMQHYFSLPNVNSGINMMKYVVVHPDHFVSPGSAFIIGFLCMWNIVAAECINIYITITINDYKTLLASFITYRI
jgi:hypothetical protein